MRMKLRQSTEIFIVFLKLGLIAFGGPIAHISFFHKEFVTNRKWLSETSFSELVTLCQFLPGPASSQLGMAIGAQKQGLTGAFVAFLGFTFPAALFMILFALGLKQYASFIPAGFLHGLQLAAIAVVLQAVWQLGSKLCPDKHRILLMIFSSALCTFLPGILGQMVVIFIGGVIGFLFLKETKTLPILMQFKLVSKKEGLFCLTLFVTLLLFLPLFHRDNSSPLLQLMDRFYRIGSLVFGGGHVVLSLLEEEIVAAGLVGAMDFASGYGFAQTIPGPLFSISAFLGLLSWNGAGGVQGGVVSLFAIFLPGYLILFGVLPFWEDIRKFKSMSDIMRGINASVVGLLVAVLYQPLFINSVVNAKDFYFLAIGFVLLQFWNVPSFFIVLFLSLGGLVFL